LKKKKEDNSKIKDEEQEKVSISTSQGSANQLKPISEEES
jgi:hypothetical protein